MGDVSNDRRELEPGAHVDLRDCDLHWKALTTLVLRIHAASFVHLPGTQGRAGKLFDIAAMTSSDVFGDQDVKTFPHHLIGRISKKILCGRVEESDPMSLIDGHDPVVRGRNHGSKTRIPECVLLLKLHFLRDIDAGQENALTGTRSQRFCGEPPPLSSVFGGGS